MISFRKLVRKLTLSAVSLGLFFVGAEIALRIAEPGPFSFVDRSPYVDVDPAGDLWHKPGFVGRWDATWYEINSLGMRGPEFEPNFEENELRVVCVGDSCTLGKGVLEAETWPRVLEDKLESAFQSAELPWQPKVGNLGINGGDGRSYEQTFVRVGQDLKPNLVVVGYNLNDFPNSIQAVDQSVYREATLRTLMPDGFRDSMNRSALYRYMRATYYEMRRERDWRVAESLAAESSGLPMDSPVWQEQRKYLKAIRDRAAAQGGRTMVLLFPYESQLYLKTFNRNAIDRLAEMCTDLDLPFVNLADHFVEAANESKQNYFLRGDRYHPNPAGYQVVGEAIMKELRARDWFSLGSTEAKPAGQ
ncbi:MAG: GDSL-type esterase/lipase family protein [Planctomycetota bacterium]|nr:GDSL-type esterase/lipase family protein [Planctomycetota bacterium]